MEPDQAEMPDIRIPTYFWGARFPTTLLVLATSYPDLRPLVQYKDSDLNRTPVFRINPQWPLVNERRDGAYPRTASSDPPAHLVPRPRATPGGRRHLRRRIDGRGRTDVEGCRLRRPRQRPTVVTWCTCPEAGQRDLQVQARVGASHAVC